MVFEDSFLQLLKSKSFVDIFNPYTDHCTDFDTPEAVNIRSNNLLQYIKKMGQHTSSSIWVAEALGHRGGRRTGIAMTDDSSLSKLSQLLDIPGIRTACTNHLKEITANQTWSQLEALPLSDIPFLWNIFPFHPHQYDKPLSNRPLKSYELAKTEDITHQLIDFFEFDRMIAIGRKSFKQLKKLGYDPIYVRHPSHGGSRLFGEQIRKIYSLE